MAQRNEARVHTLISIPESNRKRKRKEWRQREVRERKSEREERREKREERREKREERREKSMYERIHYFLSLLV